MKTEKTVRIGIIGCGGIANGKHLPALQKLPNAALVAFCDIIPEKAEQAKEKYGAPGAYAVQDYRALLEDKSIDAVHICTPNRSHCAITVDALEAGKHVMCEKPMAISAAQAKEMLLCAERCGKLLTIGYQNRQLDQNRYIKQEALRVPSGRSITAAPLRCAAAPFRPGASF